jgi:hypothetical protein
LVTILTELSLLLLLAILDFVYLCGFNNISSSNNTNRMAMHVSGSGRGLFYGTVLNLLGEIKNHHEEHLTAGNYINITLVTASSTAEMKI